MQCNSNITTNLWLSCFPMLSLSWQGASSTSSGGVIVLHERWGLTPAMRDIAKRISQESELILLIPDLYRGKLAETKEKAEQYKVQNIFQIDTGILLYVCFFSMDKH